jgi:hypothetical protein
MSGALCDLGVLGNSRYALISKPHRLKPPPLPSTNLKKFFLAVLCAVAKVLMRYCFYVTFF